MHKKDMLKYEYIIPNVGLCVDKCNKAVKLRAFANGNGGLWPFFVTLLALLLFLSAVLYGLYDNMILMPMLLLRF